MAQPDVNDLFPAKSTDELFPAAVEQQNYRRQTLGTSPIQDLIFGNTEVNPIARVLDHFGQGFKQSWGDTQDNLSKETEDTLKVNKLFDGWNQGKSSIVKAANDSLFRPAAVQLVREVHDAEALGRAASGLFTGGQAAVAQVGQELSGGVIDKGLKAVGLDGTEKLGREIAAGPEAFMGTPHPTGMPAAPHAIPDLPKAASLKVIGAGEDGYFGTAPSVEVPATMQRLDVYPSEAPAGAAKGMPVDLFAEPRDTSVGTAPVKETAPVEPGLPAPEAAEAAPAKPIAADVAQKLTTAGRPAEEAQASGELIASHYEARAQRFNGERGTPEQMYVNDGADIRSGDGAAPAKSESIKPPEGDTAEAAAPVVPALDGGAAEPIKTVPELKKALRGRAAADPKTWSLYEFLAKEGGLKPTDDLKSTLGGKNPFVPGFGPLLRPTGLTMEEALTRAKENSYILDPNDLAHAPHSSDVQSGELSKTTNDLHELIDEESRGRKQYRNDHMPKEKAVNPEEERTSILDALHRDVTAAGGKVDPALEDRVVEIVQKEGISDVHDAYERAIMEEHDKHEGLLNDRRNTKETAQIRGHDAPDSGAAPHSLQEFVDDSGYTWASEQEARGSNVGEPSGHGANDRSAAELELNQIKRGKINIRTDAKPIITLFKEANASTFIHETGHAWLEELMKDAEHPLAPKDLKTDARKVLDWLGLTDAQDIKTSHHEKFARGFERYMMEGKAPNQALAGVFAKFKNWLTKIYQTVNRLKSPINDEIRGVFDRLVTMKPSDVKIEPEGPAKTFADIHEADAEHTPPEMAHPAAETIQAERDSVAARHIPEDNNARLKGTPDEAGRSKAGDIKPASDADAAGANTGEAGSAEASGAVGAGGTQAENGGPRTSAKPREQAPITPHDKFPDKAGNITLANINTPNDVLQVLRDSANRNNDFLAERRNVLTDVEALSLAEAMGMDAAFLDTKQIGAAWNKEEIFALNDLLIKSSTDVHAAMNGTDVAAYGEAQARFLMLHDMVQGKYSGAMAEAGRSLQAFSAIKKMKGTADAAALAEMLKQGGINKTLFQLEQEMKFGKRLQTPGLVAKFTNDTKMGNFRGAILEYYINCLISGPFTHVRYGVGNAVGAVFTPLVEIPMAAAIGRTREIITGEKVDRVHLGEAGAQLYGIMKGSRDGWVAAVQAFQDGVSPPLPTERVSAHFSQPNRAIPGKAGQIYNIPSRSVAGIHSFFKALRYEQKIQGSAFRTAMNEGLEGDAFNSRIADLTTSPTEAMMTEATSETLRDLYMSPTEYHSFMGLITRAANINLAAKIVVPFMKIGTQITRGAFIDRTPLGLLTKDIRDNFSGGGVKADLQAGKIAAGTALIGSTVGMVLEGAMTGDGPTNPDQRKVWLLAHKPNHVQIGDVSFSYQGLGSLGMLMRFAANMTETAHAMGDKDMGTLAVSFFEGFTTSVLDENFMRGVKDLTQAMYHFPEYGPQYIKSMVTNWMPWSVGMSQTARFVDPYQREQHGIFQAAQAKIPWLSKQLMPRRDMFGEPIPSGGSIPEYASDPVVKAMDGLHMAVGKMNKSINGVKLSEQQYDDVSRIAGRMAKARLNAMVDIISNPNVPPAKRVEMIHTAISSSRFTARELVKMQSVGKENDIVKQSMDAKIAKLRPETAH